MSDDPSQFQVQVITGIAELKTMVGTLVGEEGRVTKLEEQVQSLNKTKWTIGGVIAVGATLAHGLLDWLPKLFGRHQ